MGQAEKKKENKGTFRCPLCGKCGGCRMDGRTYQEAAAEKEDWLNEVLGRHAARLYEKRIHLTRMENPYHYRYKVNAAVGHRGDEIITGTYAAKSHRICSIRSCAIEHAGAAGILKTIRELCQDFKIRSYNEDTGYGLLRHVQLRFSRESGGVMVILVTADPVFPAGKPFAAELVSRHPEVETVVLNINDRATSMVLGPRNITLYGSGKIADSLCGIRFRISPGDFYQVNPVMTEKIYRTALAFGKLKQTDRVLDAYCGVGTVGMTAASRVKSVTGVELNREAVADAVKNARMNHIRNISFLAEDCTTCLTELAAEGKSENRPDVIFMDPPRTGSTPEFLEAVKGLGIPRVVYISCGPLSLDRDLKMLESGYRVSQIQAFDQFPWTDGDVETVVSLKKKD